MSDNYVKLAVCQHCHGTGQPGGIMGGPEHGVCGYCMGSGYSPIVPDPRDAIISRYREALKDIAESDDIENCLDPARNKRVARVALRDA